MPHPSRRQNRDRGQGGDFLGYSPPTSNTTYTPNQFFDVVLPHASRGCLRLVAYLIRKTLGWSDAQGNPQNPEALVSYKELIEKAGIGRARIREALDEAIEKKFINCLRPGRAHSQGQEGCPALYSLRWDDRGLYVTKPDEFEGFFSGNGNLTHIPNQFFDYTIPNETAALVKVVGVIIRHTIGFQTRFGFRRQQVALSFSEIMRKAGIASRSTVNLALKDSIEKNHVIKAIEGKFDPYDGQATTYMIRWAEVLPSEESSKIEPALAEGDQAQNRTRPDQTVPKSDQTKGSQIEPGKRSRIEPESSKIALGSVPESNQQEFQNQTTVKTTGLNNTPKQHKAIDAVPVELQEVFDLLINQGFSRSVALALSKEHEAERIQRQIEWQEGRQASRNRLGMLRKAIEEDWPQPEGAKQSREEKEGESFARSFYRSLAGRTGISLLPMTDRDVRLGASFLKALEEEGIESRGSEEEGASFGEFCRSRQKESRSPARSLSLLITLYAEPWMEGRLGTALQESEQDDSEARAQHQVLFSEDFKRYEEEAIEKAMKEHPEWVEEFEDSLAAQMERMRDLSPRFFNQMEQSLQNPNERLALFGEDLRKRRKEVLLDFWAWDKDVNAQPFQPSARLKGQRAANSPSGSSQG